MRICTRIKCVTRFPCYFYIAPSNALAAVCSARFVPPLRHRCSRCRRRCCRLNIAEMKSSDGVNSQLSISRSDRHDSGPYKCTAENPFGKSEHTIYLAVQGNLSFMHARFWGPVCLCMCVYICVCMCGCVRCARVCIRIMPHRRRGRLFSST